MLAFDLIKSLIQMGLIICFMEFLVFSEIASGKKKGKFDRIDFWGSNVGPLQIRSNSDLITG